MSEVGLQRHPTRGAEGGLEAGLAGPIVQVFPGL